MPSTNESNLGLSLGWTLGEDNWNTGMDANIAILGAMSNLSVKSRTTKVKPVSPADGDRYYIPTTATGVWADYKKNIAVYSAFHSDWFYIPIKYGMEFRIQNESNLLVFYNGTSLVSSNTGGGGLEFDPTAPQTITGEWKFDLSGGKSFIVSDDPTMVSPTNILGIFDHIGAVDSSSIMSLNQVSNTLGSSNTMTQISADDDGSVLSLLDIRNDNGYAAEGMSVEPDGSSSKSVVVGDYTVNIDGSFYVVDDETTPTKYFGIFDSVDLPATGVDDVYGHNTFVSGDNGFSNYWYYDKTDFSGGYVSAAKNANGEVIEGASVLADGTSEKTITADTIKLTGVQQHVGLKIGTLASPPAGMVIGEVWLDTTDSSVYPIYRGYIPLP